MIIVDSSIWIDFFADAPTVRVDLLDKLIRTSDSLVVGDLILAEVLQGCGTDREFARVRQAMTAFRVVTIAGTHVAIAAARHYRTLRGRGITPRKTIDTLIATRCILDGLPLLYSDRDFDPFVAHLGLRSAADEMSGEV